MKKNMMEILQTGEMVKAGQMVACKLIPEMEVYGFMPMKEDECFLDLNMQDTRIVANRIVVNLQNDKLPLFADTKHSKAIPYPIYKAIALNKEEQQIPLRLLRVISREGISHYYTEYQKTGVAKPQLFKDEKLVKVTDNGEVVPCYKMAAGEYTFFERGAGAIKAVASCFEVLCRRINQVTGCLTYELYNAEDLYCQIEEKEA